ncbi:MAG: metallophosphoesterase [Ruminococcus sp.]|nr:metallophosphoesterase [Ruminococcus sp.]
MLWILLLLAVISAAVFGSWFYIKDTHSIGIVQKLNDKNVVLGWAAAALPFLVCLSFALIDLIAFAVTIIHLVMFRLLAALVRKIACKASGKEITADAFRIGAIIVTVIYMGIGWFCAHHVFLTKYEFTTDKQLPGGSLRIAEIADLHLGITLDGDGFAEECEKMSSSQKPDVVVVTGDFVDDSSKRADMIKACKALGDIDCKYGVYFIYGNHDKGYRDHRDFTYDDLDAELEKNGVTILRDEIAQVEGFNIIGRKDRSFEDDEGRMTAQELMELTDPSRFNIMLDHQPNDYANEAKAGPDMVLSGHTHGGHIFPAQLFMTWGKMNDRVYGTQTRESTTFVVSSGISGWAIPFKTGTISEIVIIDVAEK